MYSIDVIRHALQQRFKCKNSENEELEVNYLAVLEGKQCFCSLELRVIVVVKKTTEGIGEKRESTAEKGKTQ